MNLNGTFHDFIFLIFIPSSVAFIVAIINYQPSPVRSLLHPKSHNIAQLLGFDRVVKNSAVDRRIASSYKLLGALIFHLNTFFLGLTQFQLASSHMAAEANTLWINDVIFLSFMT